MRQNVESWMKAYRNYKNSNQNTMPLSIASAFQSERSHSNQLYQNK
jgi:hypothetical protein